MTSEAADRPVRWRPDLAANVVDGDAAYLVSELEVLALEGRLANALVASIDGRSGVETLVTKLASQYPPDRVRAALAHLIDDGLIVEYLSCAAPGVDLFEAAGASGAAAARAIGAVVVSVDDLADQGTLGHVQALRDAGVRVCDDATEATMSVVLVTDYLQHELESVNRDHLATGLPWLLARPHGRVVWTGPLFVPGTTAAGTACRTGSRPIGPGTSISRAALGCRVQSLGWRSRTPVVTSCPPALSP